MASAAEGIRQNLYREEKPRSCYVNTLDYSVYFCPFTTGSPGRKLPKLTLPPPSLLTTKTGSGPAGHLPRYCCGPACISLWHRLRNKVNIGLAAELSLFPCSNSPLFACGCLSEIKHQKAVFPEGKAFPPCVTGPGLGFAGARPPGCPIALSAGGELSARTPAWPMLSCFAAQGPFPVDLFKVMFIPQQELDGTCWGPPQPIPLLPSLASAATYVSTGLWVTATAGDI